MEMIQKAKFSRDGMVVLEAKSNDLGHIGRQ